MLALSAFAMLCVRMLLLLYFVRVVAASPFSHAIAVLCVPHCAVSFEHGIVAKFGVLLRFYFVSSSCSQSWALAHVYHLSQEDDTVGSSYWSR
jgi:hypothetical protein